MINVGELIAELQTLPPELPVWIDREGICLTVFEVISGRPRWDTPSCVVLKTEQDEKKNALAYS